jgi:GDP-D-mannose dehydratase
MALLSMVKRALITGITGQDGSHLDADCAAQGAHWAKAAAVHGR